nr:hypothetical protein Iba_chr01bCG19810 [Ipomoea batatas]
MASSFFFCVFSFLNFLQVNSECQGTWHAAQNDLLHKGQVDFPMASPVSLTNMAEQSRERQFIPGQLTSSMFASTLAMICLLMHSEQNEAVESKANSDEDASLRVRAVESEANSDEDASLTVGAVKSETNKAS